MLPVPRSDLHLKRNVTLSYIGTNIWNEYHHRSETLPKLLGNFYNEYNEMSWLFMNGPKVYFK